MNIYEKLILLTAKEYKGLDKERQKNSDFEYINEIIKNMGKEENEPKFEIAWKCASLWPGEFHKELTKNTEIGEYEFSDVLTDPYDKDIRFDKITIFTKRQFDDEAALDPIALEDKCKAHEKQVCKYINKLKDIPNLNFGIDRVYDTYLDPYSYSVINFVEDGWAIKELSGEKELLDLWNIRY